MSVELAESHTVKFVRDDQLPQGQDWALLECDEVTYFVVKESRISERVLEDAWAAYRRRRVTVTPLERRLRAG